MVHPGEPTRLADDEYTWVMHWAKRGGPDDPDEISRYRDLCARLNDTISDPEHQERTAYHEAAHAVVAHALRFGVTHASIADNHSGKAHWTAPVKFVPTPEQARQNLLNQATASAAGYVAEQMKWGRGRGAEQGLMNDVTYWLYKLYEIEWPPPERVRSALAGVAGLPIMLAAAALVEQQEESAQAILRSNWATVERLAARLLTQRRIEGAELAALLVDVKA